MGSGPVAPLAFDVTLEPRQIKHFLATLATSNHRRSARCPQIGRSCRRLPGRELDPERV